uniref:ATP-dependent Clp protease proteolytic subunit n=1 Tax=Pilea glauca (nom. nud.) TaxID=2789716 RepID=A0A7T0NC88_9ROSA|nr:clp protease proteolytic subunit [Pilea glauca (nom. nud.)]QPK42199.1 clp protease proteolytic subunit [Pilea glauca (nom. nud.)]
MPIGVPQVTFQNPGDEEESWIDLYNRLYRERVIFLGQEVDADASNQLIGLMVYLSVEDDTKDLYLFINSPGGSVIPGLAVYDTMQFVQPDIQTICVGLAASMASFLLVGGEITKRIAFPHAWVMIHQPSSSFYKTEMGRFILEVGELLKMRETLTKVYAQRTGKSLWVVSEDMERDAFMSAREAQTYGLIDLVAVG